MRVIRVVAGMAVKEPSDLGWDPTMLVHVKDKSGNLLDPMRSYDALPRCLRSDTICPAPDHSRVVDMRMPGQANGANPKTEKFLLFRQISAVKPEECINGRSTQVWLAWRWTNVLMGVEPERRKVSRHCYGLRSS